MKATTIKLDGDLLRAIEADKPRGVSVTRYVREVVAANLQRQAMRRAGKEYQQFLEHDKDERGWLDDWQRADLATPPKRRRS